MKRINVLFVMGWAMTLKVADIYVSLVMALDTIYVGMIKMLPHEWKFVLRWGYEFKHKFRNWVIEQWLSKNIGSEDILREMSFLKNKLIDIEETL